MGGAGKTSVANELAHLLREYTLMAFSGIHAQPQAGVGDVAAWLAQSYERKDITSFFD